MLKEKIEGSYRRIYFAKLRYPWCYSVIKALIFVLFICVALQAFAPKILPLI